MRKYTETIICSSLALLIGIVIGITSGFFGQALHFAEEFRQHHYIFIVPFLGFAGLLILYIYKKFSPESEQGLDLAIAYNMGKVDTNGKIKNFGNRQKTGKYPKPYALLKLFSNFTMLLFGASTGKEGSFAAFGAAIGDYVSRIFKSRKYSRTLLMCGVSAALSGLFQTPMGGVFFALEFTASGIMSYSALLPVVISSYCALLFSRLCGYTAFSHTVSANLTTDFKNIFLLILCAIIFGLIGKLFAIIISKTHSLYNEKVKNRYKWIFITGSVMAVIFIFVNDGRYCGTGANILSDLFLNSNFNLYDFALKFVFTIICITVGFSGGEMMPLLTIGATLGATLSYILGLPLELTAAIGCVALYSSATNTLIAPIFIGIEMFGTDIALYIALSCVLAYAINQNHSVYSMQGRLEPWVYGKLKSLKKR